MSERERRRFAENLKRCRGAVALSQEATAARAGLHRTEIVMLENRERTPRLDTIVNLSQALEARPEELLRGLGWP